MEKIHNKTNHCCNNENKRKSQIYYWNNLNRNKTQDRCIKKKEEYAKIKEIPYCIPFFLVISWLFYFMKQKK